ncbi:MULTISPECIES: IS110 family transposase [Janibacter]|nr:MULTISPECIES: IS110 family transposase [Janibacter]MCT2292038.1 IS110 family transposase [Janibacter hoylei]
MTPDAPLTNPLPPPSGLVAGVDTHKNTHHVAILDLVGRPVADREFRADGRGYAQVIAFLHEHGDVARVGVEGTGSYGAGLVRALNAAGLTVIEVARQDRQTRRRRGKSDPLDAHQAAVAVLAGTDTAIPKSGDGAVESMRILLAERRSAAKARAQVMNQIHALLITAPELVRQAFRHLSGQRLVNTLAKTRPGTIPSPDPDVVARQTLRRFALRYLTMQAEIDLIEQQLDFLARQVNPTLLSLSGVGPVTAATLLVAAGDNPERLGTRASFAALAGVAPIPASSGQRTRHRLSRGGNRHANAALHRIVLLRMRHREPRTTVYFERRRAEQLTDRDIMRCLKRHVANEVYAALLNPAKDHPAGHELRARRQAIGTPISVLAQSLGVPYQRLRRLEIGTRADPELERLATLALDKISPPQDA